MVVPMSCLLHIDILANNIDGITPILYVYSYNKKEFLYLTAIVTVVCPPYGRLKCYDTTWRQIKRNDQMWKDSDLVLATYRSLILCLPHGTYIRW